MPAVLMVALARPVYWKQVLKTERPPSERQSRILGILALIVSASCCAFSDHPSMVILVGMMLLAVVAFIVSMLLVCYPS